MFVSTSGGHHYRVGDLNIADLSEGCVFVSGVGVTIIVLVVT